MRVIFAVLCVSFAVVGDQNAASAATVIANDFIRLDSRASEFTIGIGTEDLSHAFATFAYSGHSVDLVERSADLQYYRIAHFSEVFNPLDPRIEEGLVDGGLGEVGTGDFYLGVWIPIFDIDTGTFKESGQWYGWVHLRPISGTVTMVANAMSFDSRGIVVGTLEVVPEPRSAGLALVALVTCGAAAPAPLIRFRWSSINALLSQRR
jgi:hypothetical protein